MKKRILSALFLLAVCIAALASCFGTVDPEGVCTVYVEGADGVSSYEAPLSRVEDTDGLFAVLKYLKSESKLEYVAENSTYGAYLLSVGAAEPKAETEYVKIYTSYEGDFDTSEYFDSMEYQGIAFGTAGLGASMLTVKDGVCFYICVGAY